MAWTTDMVLMTRYLVNDIDSATYSDARLKQSLVIAANLVLTEINFDQSYTIDIGAVTISPDPTVVSPKDVAFINLVCLKTAVVIFSNEAKLASRQGITVKDGPSSIDTSGRLSSSLQMLDRAKADFDKAKVDYLVGNARAGQIILGPYTVENISGGDGIE